MPRPAPTRGGAALGAKARRDRAPRAFRRDDPPILLPREPAASGPLPRAVPILAVLGLAVLFCCTLPAVRAQRRLERTYAERAAEVRRTEAEIETLRREVRGGRQRAYQRIKATQDLLHGGAAYVGERDRRLRAAD